jgi:hypothetical protein
MSPKTLLAKHHLDRRAVSLLTAAPSPPPNSPIQFAGNTLLDTEQLSAWLGVSGQTLRIWRMKKYRQGPPFVAQSKKCVRYRVDSVLAWLRSREKLSPKKAGTAK